MIQLEGFYLLMLVAAGAALALYWCAPRYNDDTTPVSEKWLNEHSYTKGGFDGEGT